jgi:hypothetical protein
MPFKSEKQKRLIYAAANNPKFAKKVGFKQEAAKKFIKDAKKESKFSKIDKIMEK